jgi:hypothetical protein
LFKQFKEWLSQGGSQFALIVLAFSIALNVVFYVQLRNLRQDHSHDEQPALLEVGERVPDLKALKLDSTPSEVSLQASKLLMVFSKDCPACQANFQNWTALEQRIGPENVLYISVNPLQEARQYAEAREIDDRTVLFADGRQAREDFKIARIPQTILVQGNEVKAIHLGVLSPGLVEQFSRAWQDLEPDSASSSGGAASAGR